MCRQLRGGYKPSNLSNTLKLTVSHNVHPSGISNPKNHCFQNAVLQYFLCISWTIIHNYDFNASAEGHISKSQFDTAHDASSSQGVNEL